jgi:hypothetical protein
MDTAFMGGCSLAWLGLVVAVAVIAIARKWVFEEAMSQEFNFFIGIATAALSYFFAIGFIGAYKWATLISMICGLLAGYFAPMFMGGGDGGNSDGF